MRASQKGLILAIGGVILGLWLGVTYRKKYIEIRHFDSKKTMILPLDVVSSDITISYNKKGEFDIKIGK